MLYRFIFLWKNAVQAKKRREGRNRESKSPEMAIDVFFGSE